MEKECEEKKVLEQEAAEELKDEQMECVSGGQEGTGEGDTKKEVGLGFILQTPPAIGEGDTKKEVGLGQAASEYSAFR